MCVAGINISESGNSFMTGAACYGRGVKKRCSRKNNNHVAVDVFIHAAVDVFIHVAGDPEKTTR